MSGPEVVVSIILFWGGLALMFRTWKPMDPEEKKAMRFFVKMGVLR